MVCKELLHRTQVLDHLGLVSGMFKELDISGIIDRAIPKKSEDKILSTGEAIVGLILNGLGFVNKRLYLVSRFFKNKPVDKLLGNPFLTASHLNDDALGRALDAVYEFGVSELYALISQKTIQYLHADYGLELAHGHLDNTNFHLHSKEKLLCAPPKEGETEGEVVLHITHGHSKDHRHDLVLVGLQLIVNHQSRIPLLLNVLNGNAEESKSYGSFVENHVSQLQNDYKLQLLVVDSKLYNQDNLNKLFKKSELKWLTRVPHTLGCVKEVFTHLVKSEWKPLKGYEQDYTYQEVGSIYGGVAQRWLVLHSRVKYQKDLLRFDKKIANERQKEAKSLKKLSRKEFVSQELALKAANELNELLQYSFLENIAISPKNYYSGRGKPKKEAIPKKTTYKINADILPDDTPVKFLKSKAGLGCFILATNELEEESVPLEKLLKYYKNQASAERAFRFLKDPNIVASSLFVQKPERIMAILMVMTLCLLVYSALEFKTRTLLKREKSFFKNQIGKPIQNPSMRWIFECFEGGVIGICR